MGKFGVLLIAATVALNVFGPVAHADEYLVNGHAASKTELQFLASYSAPAGDWRVDGYGISRVAGEGSVSVAQAPSLAPRCWYVLDVKLCD